MRKYIEMAEAKAGSQIALAKYLGQYDSGLRAVKSGKKGLPAAVCIKLAEYIGVDRLEVIAASHLVTEKNEERRKIFESCLIKEKATAIIVTITPETTQAQAASAKCLTINNINCTKNR